MLIVKKAVQRDKIDIPTINKIFTADSEQIKDKII